MNNQGMREGKGRVEDCHGMIIEEGEYMNDCLIHGNKYYNNYIISTGQYENGLLIKGSFYYPQSNIMYLEGEFKGNKPHGIVKRYNKDGSIHSEGHYLNGAVDGIMKYFYPSGKVKEEMIIKDEKKNGLFIRYKEDGNKEIETTFVNDIENGMRKTYLDHNAHYIQQEVVNGNVNRKGKEINDIDTVFEGEFYQNNKYYQGTIYSYNMNESSNEKLISVIQVEKGIIKDTMQIVAEVMNSTTNALTRKSIYYGQYRMNQYNIPVKQGKGTYFTDYFTIECNWDNDLVNSTVKVMEIPVEGTKRKKAMFTGIIDFDDTLSCLKPVLKYVQGTYTYPDGSYFMGDWLDDTVTVKNGCIFWPGNNQGNPTPKYQIQMIHYYPYLNLDMIHTCLPQGQVYYYPMNSPNFIYGMFDPMYNCIAPPISVYRKPRGTPVAMNQNVQLSWCPDGYNMNYGY